MEGVSEDNKSSWIWEGDSSFTSPFNFSKGIFSASSWQSTWARHAKYGSFSSFLRSSSLISSDKHAFILACPFTARISRVLCRPCLLSSSSLANLRSKKCWSSLSFSSFVHFYWNYDVSSGFILPEINCANFASAEFYRINSAISSFCISVSPGWIWWKLSMDLTCKFKLFTSC